MTSAEAIEHASRLFLLAEAEPDAGRMQRYECLGDSWVKLAELLAEKERV